MQRPSRIELAEIQGQAFYDESRKVTERFMYHKWPATGEAGHSPFASCMCRPELIDEDETGYEFWQHKDWRRVWQ